MKYDPITSLAYAAGAMPSVYAATLRVLFEVEKRLGSSVGDHEAWSPEYVVDWGSGSGCSAW
jgi:ribosomal protein RSM22 (predicted rRNA methylase)